jgi:hypothetical protein
VKHRTRDPVAFRRIAVNSGKLFGTKGAAVSNGRFHQQPIDECPRVMARR